jgi:hypothetical protein
LTEAAGSFASRYFAICASMDGPNRGPLLTAVSNREG